MKKILVLICFSMLVTSLLFAGGQKEGGKAEKETYTFRFGHLGTEETAYHKGAVRFAERLSELTDGRAQVTIYPGGTMGDEGDMFEQQMAGSIDFSIVNPGKIVEFTPTANIFTFPFLYKSVDHWNKVLSGDIGVKISDRIYKESDVKVIGYFGGGIRQICSRKEINSVEEIKGLVLRTNPTKPIVSAWSALGAQPTVIAYKEVYSALQMGVIDALLNEAEWILRMRFHEVAPHIALSEHDITVRFFTMSGKTWESIPADIQEAVLQAGKEASQYARDIQVKIDVEALETIKAENGITHKLDKQKIISIVKPVSLKIADEMGFADLYQDITGLK